MKNLAIALAIAGSLALAPNLAGRAHAQAGPSASPSGFTNADIKGGYACGLTGALADIVGNKVVGSTSAVGTALLVADGEGHITKSLISVEGFDANGPCFYSLLTAESNTYNVDPDGVGTAFVFYVLGNTSAPKCSTIPVDRSFRLSLACGNGFPRELATSLSWILF